MKLLMLKLEAEIVSFRATVETARAEAEMSGSWLCNWREIFDEHRLQIEYLTKEIENTQEQEVR